MTAPNGRHLVVVLVVMLSDLCHSIAVWLLHEVAALGLGRGSCRYRTTVLSQMLLLQLIDCLLIQSALPVRR